MRNHGLPFFAIAIASLTMGLKGCPQKASSFAAGLKECAGTDIISTKVLYFGPSNTVGPGSGWREAVSADGKHQDFRLRFSESDLPPPKDFSEPSKNGYSCANGKTVTFQLSTDVSASVATLPLTASLSNDLKVAKSVTITVGGVGWDHIKELNYEAYFKNLRAGNPFCEDMNSANRLVMYRALAVKDLVMKYELSSSDYGQLKATYAGTSGVGNIGGNVKMDWSETNALTITAPGNAWVLGELGRFSCSTGFAGDGTAKMTPREVGNGVASLDPIK